MHGVNDWGEAKGGSRFFVCLFRASWVNMCVTIIIIEAADNYQRNEELKFLGQIEHRGDQFLEL